MTFADIQAEVAGNIIDLPTFVTNSIPGLINTALQRIQDDHNFKVMEGNLVGQTTTISQQHLVATPTRFKEFRGNPWYVTYNGGIQPMSIVPDLESVNGWYTSGTQGDAPRFILLGTPTSDAGLGYIDVYPLPDGNSDYSDGEYRLTIPYWKYVAPLVNASDSNWFTLNADRWLVDFATSLGFQKDHDYNSLSIWAQTAKDWKLEAIKRDKLQRIASVDTLVPLWRGARMNKVRE